MQRKPHNEGKEEQFGFIPHMILSTNPFLFFFCILIKIKFATFIEHLSLEKLFHILTNINSQT